MSRHGKRSNHNAPEHTQWATCHCGKRGYLTRKLAARARRGHPHKTNLGIYRCPTHNDTWHLGHRPPRTPTTPKPSLKTARSRSARPDNDP